jgi:hypothetical protein
MDWGHELWRVTKVAVVVTIIIGAYLIITSSIGAGIIIRMG